MFRFPKPPAAALAAVALMTAAALLAAAPAAPAPAQNNTAAAPAAPAQNNTAAAPARDAYPFPGIGRNATPAEVKAWDIDVRPDFQGLPKGSGRVAKGQAIWESKCETCHGIFGESNQFFQPLVGGTSAEDVKTGRVASLKRADVERTMLMKLPTVSTLWDYINRAMPWNAPKSLATDEVYAVTAYLLSLGGVVADDYTLSDANIAEAQQRLPNRDGMTTQHAMWPGKELGGAAQPDVQGAACMENCKTEVKVASMLPDHARDAHGNIAGQVRLVGQARGDDTSQPPPARLGERPKAAVKAAAAPAVNAALAGAPAANAAFAGAAPSDLLQKSGCVACHAMTGKLIGPAFADVAQKYAGQASYLSGKISSGGSGVWGAIPMPPQAIAAEDAARIAKWLAGGAGP
jgi:cytochrome c